MIKKINYCNNEASESITTADNKPRIENINETVENPLVSFCLSLKPSLIVAFLKESATIERIKQITQRMISTTLIDINNVI